MERLSCAQQRLQQEFEKYHEAYGGPIPDLDLDSVDELEVILDSFDAKSKLDKQFEQAKRLKAALADVLLLLDGYDIKLPRER